MPGGSAALFGFLVVPALLSDCRAQSARLFGPQFAILKADHLEDWAADPLTATAGDLQAPSAYGAGLEPSMESAPWKDRLTGIASQWSAQCPGYLAAAVEAAGLGVTRGLARERAEADE